MIRTLIKNIAIFSVVLLVGCSGGHIKRADITKATELCKTNDGLKSIHIARNLAADSIICENGAVFRLDRQ